MQSVFAVLSKFLDMPTERLYGLIALASIGLAAFAIYAVLSLAK